MTVCQPTQLRLGMKKERCAVLTAYIEAAMRHARCKVFDEDGPHYCEIPECRSVWANEPTRVHALEELRSALEGWIELGLAMNQPFPNIDGATANAEGRA